MVPYVQLIPKTGERIEMLPIPSGTFHVPTAGTNEPNTKPNIQTIRIELFLMSKTEIACAFCLSTLCHLVASITLLGDHEGSDLIGLIASRLTGKKIDDQKMGFGSTGCFIRHFLPASRHGELSDSMPESLSAGVRFLVDRS